MSMGRDWTNARPLPALLVALMTTAVTGCGDDDVAADDDQTEADASPSPDASSADPDAAAGADAAPPDGGDAEAPAGQLRFGYDELVGFDVGFGAASGEFWTDVVPREAAPFGPLDPLGAFTAIDTCLSNEEAFPEDPWDVEALDVGVFVKFVSDAGDIVLDRAETPDSITYATADDVASRLFVPGTAYDVEVADEVWEDAALLPAKPVIATEGWATGEVVVSHGQDYAMTWEPLGATLIEIQLYGEGGSGVICRVTDDGEFTIPQALIETIPVGVGSNANFVVMQIAQQTLDGRPVVIRSFYSHVSVSFTVDR
jgi:hypothetical protein